MVQPSHSRTALRPAPERPQKQKPPRGEGENTNRDANSATTRRSPLITSYFAAAPALAPTDEQSATGSARDEAKTPARRNPRKRPAATLSTHADVDVSADARPPTKITVKQPHGELLRITNGVPVPLGVSADELPSGASTPAGNAPPVALAVPPPTTPAQTAPGQDKRSLRSKDGGSRLKSELATYFSNYDEIMAGVPEPSDWLELDTPIYVVDEPLRPTKRARTSSPEPSRKPSTPSRTRRGGAQTPSRQGQANQTSLPPATSSTSYQTLDYATVSRYVHNGSTTPPLTSANSSRPAADPLADSVYLVPHRRAERKEKQLRNIEKERAMHEKQQLEKLLDGLVGPDWLRVMGVHSVTMTEAEKKGWEAKRDYFVREVEALVDKFRIWKEEEKRLRAAKEAAHAKDEEVGSPVDSEAGGSGNGHGGERAIGTAKKNADREKDKDKDKDKEKDGKHTTPSHPHRTPQKRRPPQPHGYVLPPAPPAPPTPFKSFFSKPHLRTAALGKHRHGRNALAFGQPIPEFNEGEFELPNDYITPEALRDHARKRRRQRRESAVKQ